MSSAEILVVLPTLGRRIGYLSEALESFTSGLQGASARLVLVLPENACDARNLALTAGATVVDDPGLGMSAAINAGLAAREGEKYYIWFGDDDLQRPGGLLFLRNLLESNPSSPLAFAGCDYLSQSGDIIFSNRFGWVADFLQRFGPNLVPHMSALMRADLVAEVGGYDTSLKYAMDLDLFFRLRSKGRFVASSRVVSAFRTHEDSLTSGNRLASLEEARLIRRRYLSRIELMIAQVVHITFVSLFRLKKAWPSKK